MNFIKKKLKSHKKDDEEEEYEKAVYEQSLHPQNPDQKMKSTEEWQFFQQLSMRVQDTVQKTQTTLNKLKDIHQEDMDEEDGNVYDVDGELLSKDIPPYGKVLRAPPRPPPPSAEKAAVSGDLDFGSDLNHSSPAKGPPRPPPPSSSDLPFSFDSSALHGTPSKSFGSPARPPPPNATKLEHTVASDNFSLASDTKMSNVEKDSTSFSLLDEFGFNSDTVASTAPTNIQDLLFLDDKEVDDPFDTSFVDVNNPTSVHIASERKSNGTEIKTTDKSFNPFSSSTVSDDWLTSTTSAEKSKSSTTNPFFSSGLSDAKLDVSQDKRHSVSSHNPFSFSEPPLPASDAQNDLFGLNILPSSSKDNLTHDIFQTSKDSPKAEQISDDLLSVAFSNDSTKPLGELDTILPAETAVIPTESSLVNHQENAVKEEVDIWKTEPQCALDDILSAEVIKSVEVQDVSEKPLEPSLLWDTEPLQTDVLNPEKPAVETEAAIDLPEPEEDKPEKEATLDDLENDAESCSQPVLSAEPAVSSEIKIENEILEPAPPDVDLTSEPIGSKNGDGTDMNLDAFSPSPMFNDSKADLTTDTSDGFDIKPSNSFDVKPSNDFDIKPSNGFDIKPSNDFDIKPSNSFDIKPSNGLDIKPFENKENEVSDEVNAPVNSESFSKPFEGENEENAFLFKVIEKQPDLEFDAFAAKFESAKDSQGSDAFDPFMSKRAPTLRKIQEDHKGFDSMDEFDPFKVTIRPEDFQNTMKKEPSRDSFEDYDNEVDFSVVIKPKVKDSADVKLPTMEPPKLLPPPKTPTKAFDTPASRFNPFDKDFLDNADVSKAAEKSFASIEIEEEPVPALGEAGVRKSDSVETPLSPLFDEDTSLPLETFPKPYDKEGWEMVLRQPNKKKLTGNRFWKKIFVKLSENSVLQLFNKADDKLPFQELPLQDSLENFATWSVNKTGTLDITCYFYLFLHI